jgi:hypothetical protein
MIVAAIAEKSDLLVNSAYSAVWKAHAETVIPADEIAANTQLAAKIKLALSCVNS